MLGLKPHEVWDLTYAELLLYSKAMGERFKLDHVAETYRDHRQATFIAAAMSGKLKAPQKYLPREFRHHHVDEEYSIEKSRRIVERVQELRGEL